MASPNCRGREEQGASALSRRPHPQSAPLITRTVATFWWRGAGQLSKLVPGLSLPPRHSSHSSCKGGFITHLQITPLLLQSTHSYWFCLYAKHGDTATYKPHVVSGSLELTLCVQENRGQPIIKHVIS